MIELADIRVPIARLTGGMAAELAAIRAAVARRLRLSRGDVVAVELRRRSIDARKRTDIRVTFTVRVRLRGGTAAERATLARLRRRGDGRGVRVIDAATLARDATGVASAAGGACGADASERRRVAGGNGGVAVGADSAASLGGGGIVGVDAGAGRGTAEEKAAVGAERAATVLPDRRIVVVGAGSAGLFCALSLARAGLRPLLVERGDDVTRRSAAIASFNATGALDAESNVQFGLGGAGTFSDGKLATGTKSPVHRNILNEFVAAGAPRSILWDAHPHIGSDVLPGVVAKLVGAIEAAGGEVRTRSSLVDLHVSGGRATGVTLATRGATGAATEERIAASAVVLACGHSARDVFALLAARGVALERKPFAMGLRIEHAQAAIDRAQYGSAAGHPALGAAPYKLACHVGAGAARRGVFSFCMCPGGYVVAAASEPGGVVTNGMSLSGRAGANANAGLLVDVGTPDVAAAAADGLLMGDGTVIDLGLRAGGAVGGNKRGADPAAVVSVAHVDADADSRLARGTRVASGIVVGGGDTSSALAGVALQRACERAAFAAGGGAYVAPTQLLGDFLACGTSTGAGSVMPTYPRGVAWGSVTGCLPAFVVEALRVGVAQLARKLRGFDAADAVLTAVETRSSSPVRVVRGNDGVSVSTQGLYPCGEGAGYAGGIMSAAADGLRAATWVVNVLAGR